MILTAKAYNIRQKWISKKEDTVFANRRIRSLRRLKKLLFNIFRFLILAGIIYIILGPMITIITRSFFSTSDLYNPLVYLFPKQPTLDKYIMAIKRLDYLKVLGKTLAFDGTLMVIQVFICSMTGYGFARYEFPLKKLAFGLVIVTIVIPSHTIMLPLYMTFRNFDVFGIVRLFTEEKGINLLSTMAPIYIMTLLGCGLRSGLYIYIFNQFFRGLPKEFEEAAYIDGAGAWYTYFRIMLVNALPSVLTVTVFSLVWQYNDVFYAKLFAIGGDNAISIRISTLAATINYVDKIKDPLDVQLYLYAGIVLTIVPIVIIYVVLQKYFMEGVERSGIVG